jgi:hypothetical protein
VKKPRVEKTVLETTQYLSVPASVNCGLEAVQQALDAANRGLDAVQRALDAVKAKRDAANNEQE